MRFKNIYKTLTNEHDPDAFNFITKGMEQLETFNDDTDFTQKENQDTLQNLAVFMRNLSIPYFKPLPNSNHLHKDLGYIEWQLRLKNPHSFRLFKTKTIKGVILRIKYINNRLLVDPNSNVDAKLLTDEINKLEKFTNDTDFTLIENQDVFKKITKFMKKLCTSNRYFKPLNNSNAICYTLSLIERKLSLKESNCYIKNITLDEFVMRLKNIYNKLSDKSESIIFKFLTDEMEKLEKFNDATDFTLWETQEVFNKITMYMEQLSFSKNTLPTF